MATTLIGLNWLMGWITAHSHRVERWVEGVPVLLARNGQVFHEVLRQQHVSREDFAVAMREAKCEDESEIRLAVLETSGHIVVLPHDKRE